MKRIIITTLSILSLLFTTSCEKDFEEINTNPNKPQEYLPYALFNGANYAIIYYLRRSDNSASRMRGWMQYTAQTTYTDESRYRAAQADGENLWFNLYKRMNSYKEIIEMNTDPVKKKTAADYGKNENQIAAARIMLAYGFSLVVETFGDAPYYSYGDSNNPHFQGLQIEEHITPVYASQKEIYLDIFKELKAAADMIVGSDTDQVFTQGDFIFGSVGKMKRFANSLRLRIANHLKDSRDPELRQVAENIVEYYRSANTERELLQATETVELEFENSYVYPSPIFNDYFVDNRLDYAPSNVFVKFLLGNNKKANDRGTLNFGRDPRVTRICTPIGIENKWKALGGEYTTYDIMTNPADTIHYKGMPYGMVKGTTSNQFKGGEGISLFSEAQLEATAPEVFMSYAEVCFILSEIRNWDQTWYEKGIRASMAEWKVPEAQVNAFMSRAMPAASQETVLTQKYIALYRNPNEGWTEYRRTGFPKFLIRTGEKVRANYTLEANADASIEANYMYTFLSMETGIQRIPDRISYPTLYTGVNRENYERALSNMGLTPDNDQTSGRTHKLLFAENRPD